MRRRARRCTSDAALHPRQSWGMGLVGALAILMVVGAGSVPAGEVKEPSFVLAWGQKGDQPGEFSSPIGIAINKNGSARSCSSRSRFVCGRPGQSSPQQFTRDGKFLSKWGEHGTQPGQFGGNRVWVSSLNDCVQLFTREGNLAGVTPGGLNGSRGDAQSAERSKRGATSRRPSQRR